MVIESYYLIQRNIEFRHMFFAPCRFRNFTSPTLNPPGGSSRDQLLSPIVRGHQQPLKGYPKKGPYQKPKKQHATTYGWLNRRGFVTLSLPCHVWWWMSSGTSNINSWRSFVFGCQKKSLLYIHLEPNFPHFWRVDLPFCGSNLRKYMGYYGLFGS